MTTSLTTAKPAGYGHAGRLLEALAHQDFVMLADALEGDVHLRALVAKGLVELQGPADVADKFRFWFGDTDVFELLDATIGAVADRLHLSWRVRLQASRLGDGWRVVEQQAYVSCAQSGRIDRIDLLCTGYIPVAKELLP
ncbi:MAG: hypothetical protein ACKOVB_12250 [Terrabacter sp.]